MSNNHEPYTRTATFSSSLHFDNFDDYLAAGDGAPVLPGQTVTGLDNGYGLQGNPTLHGLQDSISRLENGAHSLLYPSGQTALCALEGIMENGDHWLMPAGVYGPLRRFANYIVARSGITYDLYDPLEPASVRAAITERTKLIHIESPVSATFETTPVEDVAAMAHEHGLLVSADNTWASGMLSKPLDLGVDISALSLTKYAAGHSDVFMGSLTVKDDGLFERLANHHFIHGYTVSPLDAMSVRRGLETLPVRLAAHAQNAETLIDAAQSSPVVKRIMSAGPKASSELSGSNGLFSVELDRRYEVHELQVILGGLRIFGIGESWGGTKSLVLPFQPEGLADRSQAPQGTVLRFHAGLEDVAAQTTDMQTILQRVESHSDSI
jgi:cysteine-S-conjugate beta-lyase